MATSRREPARLGPVLASVSYGANQRHENVQLEFANIIEEYPEAKINVLVQKHTQLKSLNWPYERPTVVVAFVRHRVGANVVSR